MDGWIKIHRKILDNPIVTKDAEHLAVWVWLLTHAVFRETDVIFKNKRITLRPGQLTTGRQMIADDLHINRSKVDRILKLFESEHQIEQQMSNKCRLISILSWDKYQISEHQIEQQVSTKCASSEHQVSTKEEYKKEKNVNNIILNLDDVIEMEDEHDYSRSN